MDYDRNRKTFTAQGRETPGPVGASGVEAGRSRPSSRDSLGTLVAHQAGVPTRATGGREETTESAGVTQDIDPSRRRSALARTPPQRRTLSLPADDEGTRCRYNQNEAAEEEDNAKRKRKEDSPTTLSQTRTDTKKPRESGATPSQYEESEAVANRIRGVIGKIGREVKIVAEVAKERNTKKEVKEAAAKLSSLMIQLRSADVQGFLYNPGCNTEASAGQIQTDWEERLARVESEVESLKERNVALTLENARLRAAMERRDGPGTLEVRDAETQTGREGNKNREAATGETENLIEAEIAESMRPGAGLEDFHKVMDLNWPARCFTKVSMERSDIFEIPREWDLVTAVPRNLVMDNGPNRRIRDYYQGIEELRNQDAEVGEVTYLMENLAFPTRSGAVINTERYIYHGFAAETAEDPWNISDVFAIITKVKSLSEMHQRRKIGVVVPNKINLTYLKKVVEFVFNGTEIEIKLILDPKDRKTGKGTGRKERKSERMPPRNRKEEAVIVKPEEGKSFAETLKKIKEVVDVEATGAKVAAIRRTRNGEVLLKLKSQQGPSQAESLKTAISNKMTHVNARTIKERTTTIHVNGIDGATEIHELEQALIETLGDRDAQVRVNALWPTFGGCQNASVTMPKSDADFLVNKGKVRVGWITCRIRERVEIQRCYRCWGHGHLASECSGENRGQICRKCGQNGHKAKECPNEEACWECKTGGHRGGTARCPKYRDLLAEVVKRSKRQMTKNY